MIQHFRKKFILFSTSALLLVIITIVGSISMVTFYRAHQEAASVLTILTANQGQIPRRIDQSQQGLSQTRFTRESLSQYRYFSTAINKDGEMEINNTHILSVTPTQIKQLTTRILKRDRTEGHIIYKHTTYAYQVNKNSSGTVVVFLDESLMLSKARDVTYFGVILGAISLLLYTIVLMLFSKVAIRPIIQAEQRQKEFITNAGHELKTPLSVIAANTEMEEMLDGEDDLTKSTKEQVERMTRLIDSFVSLARLQERPQMPLTTVNASELANEAADNFKVMIIQDGKKFKKSVSTGIYVRANAHYLYEVMSILLDNANKYCDPHGEVFLNLNRGKRNKTMVLSVTNTYAKGKDVDYKRFFDRFYREDKARTVTKKSGYGIGLSMAQNIVKGFGGQIKVNYENGRISFVVTMKTVKKREERA